jgi:hypothetical protein
MAVALTAADSHLYGSGGSALPNTANPFTINVWIRATWNGGGRLSFVGLYDGTVTAGTTNGAGLQIGTSAGAGEVSCWYYGGTVVIQSATAVMTTFNNQWVMCTYVWDGTNHRIYVNGGNPTNGITVTPTTTAFTAAQMTQVYINGYPPTTSAAECSSFAVDSYGSYNRALSANEVLTLYNNAGSRGGLLSGLVCQYEFDEGVEGASAGSNAGNAPRVVDMTGRGNNILHTGAANTTTYTYPSTYANANTRPVQ